MKTNLMNIRPHPGPLPQERENCSLRLDNASVPGGRTAFSANKQPALKKMTNEFSSTAKSCSLSLGGEGQGEGERQSNFYDRSLQLKSP
ncbi:MAG: hypothetical protein ACREFE_06610 [Limisphaerales bacterium]